jgi:fumarylacetoacetase
MYELSNSQRLIIDDDGTYLSLEPAHGGEGCVYHILPMASWIPVRHDSDFSLLNLPYGVFSIGGSGPRIGVRIGDFVLDVKALSQEKVFSDLDFPVSTLEEPTLNAFASLGKGPHSRFRARLHQMLQEETPLGDVLRDNQARRDKCLIAVSEVTMHLPVVVGDFTDFFIGLHHANNVSF